MAFILSQNQPSLSSEAEAEAEAQSKDVTEPLGSVTSQVLLKASSRQSMDRDAVRRRLRHHKAMSKVKNALCAIMAPPPLQDSDEKWLQQGDGFSFPWRKNWSYYYSRDGARRPENVRRFLMRRRYFKVGGMYGFFL